MRQLFQTPASAISGWGMIRSPMALVLPGHKHGERLEYSLARVSSHISSLHRCRYIGPLTLPIPFPPPGPSPSQKAPGTIPASMCASPSYETRCYVPKNKPHGYSHQLDTHAPATAGASLPLPRWQPRLYYACMHAWPSLLWPMSGRSWLAL